jgi:hypothetical protein
MRRCYHTSSSTVTPSLKIFLCVTYSEVYRCAEEKGFFADTWLNMLIYFFQSRSIFKFHIFPFHNHSHAKLTEKLYFFLHAPTYYFRVSEEVVLRKLNHLHLLTHNQRRRLQQTLNPTFAFIGQWWWWWWFFFVCLWRN